MTDDAGDRAAGRRGRDDDDGPADEAWDQVRPWMEPAARAGFAAKGVVYLIVGILAGRVALGRGGEFADSREALGVIREQPLGKGLLVLVAVGVFGYALWRIACAVTDCEAKGTDAKGMAVRLGYVGRALIYGAFGVEAIRLTLGGSESGGNRSESLAARALGWPFGRWLIMAAGAGVIIYALYQLYRAFSPKIRQHLDLSSLDAGSAEWAVRVSRFGIAARGLVFAVIGWLVIRSALLANAQKAGGVEDALRFLGTRGTGPWLLGGVALGVIAYAIYQFLNARYRVIRT